VVDTPVETAESGPSGNIFLVGVSKAVSSRMPVFEDPGSGELSAGVGEV
jgi:hypothetical protein